MSRYQFELAMSADDADLRHILAETPMEGNVVVSFRREPSYFDAAVVEGRERQVIAARDTRTGRIVGFGSRSISNRYVNGELQPIGYLSSLRLLSEHRRIGLVARGYRYFRELHSDGRARHYLTTIAVENRRALELLTSGRAGLPSYHPAGDYFTFALSRGARRACRRPPPGIEIRPAIESDRPGIVQFLREQGIRRQFAPAYQQQDFGDDRGLLRGIGLSDIRLAVSGKDILGVAAIWDQRRFRQTVVEGYRGGLRYCRPLVNGVMKLLDWPLLPRSGAELRSVYFALPFVERDDPEVFVALLDRLICEVPTYDADYLLVGCHQSDPFLPVVRSIRGRCYTTRLFLVTWDDGQALRATLDGRPIYLELGAL